MKRHVFLWMLALAGISQAGILPPGAVRYLPTLVAEQRAYWPNMPAPSTLAGQVEQETCPSLKSLKCWNPRTELKTSREYGFGFGQLTRAYRADGSVRFDTFTEVKELDASLRAWKWEDRYDPVLQLRSLVLKDLQCYSMMKGVVNDFDRLAMGMACYNGGAAGVISDRKLCQSTEDCNPAIWVGNVERTSLKSRVKWHGYGKSAFEINREYVRNILFVRRFKYEEAM